MNYEEAFRQTIAANRHDSTSYLVFADWLGEQGDLRADSVRQRGEFIDVQTRLENLQLPRHERKKLLECESKLLAANREKWIDEDMQLVPEGQRDGFNRQYLTFSKGFLDIISMTPEERQVNRDLHVPFEEGEIRINRYNNLWGIRDYNSTDLSQTELKTLLLMEAFKDRFPEDTDAQLMLYHAINNTLRSHSETNRLYKLQLLLDRIKDINTNQPSSLNCGEFLHELSLSERVGWHIEEARLLIRNGLDLDIGHNDNPDFAHMRQIQGLRDDPASFTIRQSLMRREEDDPLRQAVFDEERIYRQTLPMTEKMPEREDRGIV